MRHFFILAAFFALSEKHYAQVLPYLFTVDNEPYVELTDATSLNGNTNWEDPDYLISIGFDFYGFGEWNNEMTFGGVFGYGGELFLGSFDGSEPLNHLCPYGLDIKDPNMGTDLPPAGHILQKIDGEAPNRICKLEWRNVGFYLDDTGEMRMNFQMWLYETTNMIEFRYGPSVNFNLEAVQELNGILVGLSKDFDFNTFTFNYLWALSGDSTDPSIQSYDGFTIDFQIAEQVLQNPENGTVYRFNNLEVGVNDQTENRFKIFPNPANETLHLQWNGSDRPNNVKILSCIGQTVLNTQVAGQHESIDVSDLPAGTYEVMMQYDTHSIHQKLIIQ